MNNLSSLETIHSFLENSAEKFPNKTAVISREHSLTYCEINNRANQIKHFLITKTKKGDRIAILIENSIEFIVFYFGILKSGCIAVILNPNISEKNLLYEIGDSSPRILFFSDKLSNKIKRIDFPKESEIINIKNLKIDKSKEVENRIVTKDDFSSILYTSGTTLEPKGVLLQHDNVVNASKNITEFIKNNSNDIYLSILPIAHSFGLGNIHVSFMVGGSVIIEKNAINLKKILNTIIEKKVTFFAAAPITLKMLVENYMQDFKKAGESLRIIMSNTSAIPEETILDILNLEKTNFCYYYGLTEASRSTFINYQENKDKLGSVGRASPNTKIEIRDGEKNLGPNQIGEICIFGKHVIKKYWNLEEDSKKIKNGWFYTGDCGYLDKDGFLYISGRKDDIINVWGDKVAPSEIENFVNSLDIVKESAAVGVKDPLFNEVVKLFVVPQNKDLNESKLKEQIFLHLKKNLESFKLPKEIEIIDSLPKSDLGKIKRTELRSTEKSIENPSNLKKPKEHILNFVDSKIINFLPKTFFPSVLLMDTSGKNFLSSIKEKRIFVIISSTILNKYKEKINLVLNKNYIKFYEFSGEPNFLDREKLISELKKDFYDMVIGIGGGSILDLTKSIRMDINIGLILLPTTIGTGSETSQFSLFSDKISKKSMQSQNFLPDVVILDSSFLESLSKEDIAFSSIDALSHALEGLVSKASNPFSDALAIRAIDLIFENIFSAVDKKDSNSLKNLQIAGFLAGIVQSTASVGIAHSLAHYFGTKYNLSHSKSIALWLINVLKMNIPNSPAYSKLNSCKFTNNETIVNDCENIFSKCKINNEYSKKKIDIIEDMDAVCELIRNDICTRTNPYIPQKEEIKHLILEVLKNES